MGLVLFVVLSKNLQHSRLILLQITSVMCEMIFMLQVFFGTNFVRSLKFCSIIPPVGWYWNFIAFNNLHTGSKFIVLHRSQSTVKLEKLSNDLHQLINFLDCQPEFWGDAPLAILLETKQKSIYCILKIQKVGDFHWGILYFGLKVSLGDLIKFRHFYIENRRLYLEKWFFYFKIV